MRGIKDLIPNLKKYCKFTFKETKGIILTILVFGFIISYKEWGAGENFDLAYGLIHLILSMVVVAIILLIDQLGHKIIGLKYGYMPEYEVLASGLLFSLIIVFISRGNIWFLLPGGVTIHLLKRHRLGFFRYGMDKRYMSWVALMGPLAVVLFIMAVRNLDLWFNIPVMGTTILGVNIISKLWYFGWAFALYSLMPFPKMDGFNILYDSRLLYIFLFGSIVGYFVLTLFNIQSLIGGLFIGGLCWLTYLLLYENKI